MEELPRGRNPARKELAAIASISEPGRVIQREVEQTEGDACESEEEQVQRWREGVIGE